MSACNAMRIVAVVPSRVLYLHSHERPLASHFLSSPLSIVVSSRVGDFGGGGTEGGFLGSFVVRMRERSGALAEFNSSSYALFPIVPSSSKICPFCCFVSCSTLMGQAIILCCPPMRK